MHDNKVHVSLLRNIFKAEYCSLTVQQSLVVKKSIADLHYEQNLLFHNHITLTRTIRHIQTAAAKPRSRFQNYILTNNEINLRKCKQ